MTTANPGFGLALKLSVGGAVLGLALGYLSYLMAQGGHGTMWPAVVLFPFAWAPIAVLGPAAETLAVSIALVQYPVYAAILGQAHRRGKMPSASIALALAHALGLLFPFVVLG